MSDSQFQDFLHSHQNIAVSVSRVNAIRRYATPAQYDWRLISRKRLAALFSLAPGRPPRPRPPSAAPSPWRRSRYHSARGRAPWRIVPARAPSTRGARASLGGGLYLAALGGGGLGPGNSRGGVYDAAPQGLRDGERNVVAGRARRAPYIRGERDLGDEPRAGAERGEGQGGGRGARLATRARLETRARSARMEAKGTLRAPPASARPENAPPPQKS
jgi:hypothetical protein